MSRRHTGGANADSCAHSGLSRRQLMAGSAALAIATSTPETADPVVSLCRNWISLDTEHEALTRRWQSLENYVVREHDWFRLSDAERRLLPEAAEMSGIEARLGALSESRSDLLTRLPDVKAATLQGVALKLSVAAASVFADENPEAHALLQCTLDDLHRILETGGRL